MNNRRCLDVIQYSVVPGFWLGACVLITFSKTSVNTSVVAKPAHVDSLV